uniref:C2H2-type domain-containing protein n=1 Tax=Hucho hucho TaxID=62062 RepID=A0A4W5MVB4_9TELE
MGLYVETTVRETGRLLDECAAVLENEENSFLKREMERVNTTNTIKFASFMEVLSEGLMEKISLLMMVDKTEIRAVEKTGGGGESCGEDWWRSVLFLLLLLQSDDLSYCFFFCMCTATTKMTLSVTDEVFSSDSDNQEEDLDFAPLSSPSLDKECLIEVDPSQHADPSASDPDKQGPARDGEHVQCGDSADAAHQGPITCSYCGKCFKKKGRYTLKNHMVTHTGKKPYHCSVCGKGFFSKHLLKVHIHIHTGEKPFECDQCGKRFGQKSHLKYHERAHTGVKAFVCGICGKAYANRQNLKLHKCSASAKL